MEKAYRLKVPISDLPPMPLRTLTSTTAGDINLGDKFKGVVFYVRLRENGAAAETFKIDDGPTQTLRASANLEFTDVRINKITFLTAHAVNIDVKYVPIDEGLKKNWIEKG